MNVIPKKSHNLVNELDRVDPTKMTDYNRSDAKLQMALLFSVAVAGKTAWQVSRALESFIARGRATMTGYIPYDPTDSNSYGAFHAVREMDKRGVFDEYLKGSGLGQYKKITRAFKEIAYSGINLRTCTVEDLEKFHGIGPKTARFFLLHTRPNQRIACLDTHVLRFMRERLGINTPKTTPNGKKYLELEKRFIEWCDTGGRDIAEIDLEIWNYYAKKEPK